ncbi:hypothetical protein EPA93_30210 [Ktedonosporobacter rubrisoli]|uniref:Uncharacterized protein n=1 Tax=Ktedonosporobacter rubrisoli TaxID=2509675 RepID=A0A4P6JWF2_KTERU|nr:hypothetical protein [Ktedonosporobacter rubrisoli]QBD80027.1 hypothetical protein EPA93_30210 [Ktedonosporobacter rubrisoli]
MKKLPPVLDQMRPFVASLKELIAIGDAIHVYAMATQHGLIPKDISKQVLPVLESFHARIVRQLGEEK